MYRRILRPLLFLFPPEFIHKLVALGLRGVFIIPGIPGLARRIFTTDDPRLEREVFGLKFPNPIGIAAGFDKGASLYNPLSCLGFGHVEIGTVTPLAQPGNPQPRIFRIPQDEAMINRMGFNNHGVEAFVKRLKKEKPRVIVGGNIGKNTLTPNEQAASDYCLCFETLFDHVDYFVVNVSCPNIKGLSKLQDKDTLVDILRSIQNINQSKPKPKPLLLKIAPGLSDSQLDEIIEIVHIVKLSGVVATNTSPHREGLSLEADKVEKLGQGGLSGRPLRSESTRTIAYLHKKSGGRFPIIGVGGIFNAQDAMEKLKAGASLVQVYTGFIYNGPFIAKKISRKLLNTPRQPKE